MFEKLFSLLLHAKGGALATVLVIGASGALVTATVANGTATVTITQPSADTSAATTPSDATKTNTTTTNAILALFNRTSAENDPTTPATGGNGCSDEAHARNEQMKRVDAAFKTDHAAVLALSKDAPKTDAARKLVKDADKAIKDIRQAAVKAIHATFKSADCKDKDDEDKDNEDENDNEDDDNGSTTGTTTGTT
ncbi:MAG: hypothetical protein ABJB39_04785, partial [Chloroflexota bacterium]